MFTAQQEKLREKDDLKVVRTFKSSSVIFEGDSKIRRVNPDHYQPICLTEEGRFVDESGRPIPKSRIPADILAESEPPRATPIPERQEISLADAMQASARNDDPTPTTRRPVGRPRKTK